MRVLLLAAAMAWIPARAEGVPPVLRPEILGEIAHDSTAFTQGLLWCEGKLYESTGLYGKSSLRELDPATGAVRRIQSVPAQYFGEGLAQFKGELVQLTWKAEIALRYPVKDWRRPPSHFRYAGEGWGLTTLGQHLWMSNGSDTLYRRNGAFQVTARVPVKLAGLPLSRLNELEGVGGKILANIWYSDSLAIINPYDGRVVALVDCSALTARSRRRSRDDVLNGLAYDARKKQFFITGKNWPVMFKARIPFAF